MTKCTLCNYTFILPLLLTEGKEPSFSTFMCCIVHYFHNSFVLNNQDEGDHLPNLCTIDGVRDLLSLFAATMFFSSLQSPTLSGWTPLVQWKSTRLRRK